MEGQYQVFGLSAPASFTFRNEHGSWWAVSALLNDRYKSLFKWAKSDERFWKNHTVMATVEHTGLSSDGTPMNGKITDITILSR